MTGFAVVVPFGRPERLGNVLSTWKAQTVPSALVLVSRERGWWSEAAEAAGARCLHGAATIGGARNAGMDEARRLGADWAAFFDDDDYYAPRYLEQARDHVAPELDALTQGIGFVRFPSGLRLFEKPLHFTPGHCTLARLSAAPLFPEASLGEDVAWGRRLEWRRVGKLPPWRMVYYRTATGHAYRISEHELTKCHEPYRDLGDAPDSFADEPRGLEEFPLRTLPDEAVFAAMRDRRRESRRRT